MPLQVGNRWIWQLTFYDTLGHPYAVSLDSLTIDSVKNVDSELWFFPGQPYWKLAFANLVGGCYYRAFSDTPGPSFLFYKYPATIYDTYKAPVGLVSVDHVWIVDTLETITVLSTDTTITVPAGSFRCYLYQRFRNNGDFFYDEFLSPGWGWIRIVTYVRMRYGGYYKQSSKELAELVHSH
jgi:hypothetical protein